MRSGSPSVVLSGDAQRYLGADFKHPALCSGKAAFAGGDEGDDGVSDGAFAAGTGLELFECLTVVERGAENQLKDPAGLHDVLIGQPHALHADLVNGAVMGGVAVGNHEGQHVLHELGTTADHGAVPNPAKLVHCGQPADDDAAADDTVSAQSGVVAENTLISDMALVADVGVGTEQVVGAHPGFRIGEGGRMQGAELAKDVVITDAHGGFIPGPFFILSAAAEEGIGKDLVVLSHGGIALDGSVVVDATSGPEAHHRADVGIGTDFHPCPDDRPRLDNGRGMDFGGWLGWVLRLAHGFLGAPAVRIHKGRQSE